MNLAIECINADILKRVSEGSGVDRDVAAVEQKASHCAIEGSDCVSHSI
jgi:hypothetical protein